MTRYRLSNSIPDVDVQTRGDVPADATGYARLRIAVLARHTHEPILHARVRLTMAGDPAVARPAIAQASLDLDGRLVRAHVAAKTMLEAIDMLHDRLRRRLERMAEHWEARRGGLPVTGDHEWRHGDEPSRRPDYYPRPSAEREIVRHKSFTFAVETAEEAAVEMDTMDYEFHLFTEVETGLDCVIYRGGPTGYRLAYTAIGQAQQAAARLSVSPHPAPRLHLAEAVERLELTGWPFVFFVDAECGRGNVLYHRYDGHYGLITPAG